MMVFSSDHPHGEGNVDPVALFGPALSELRVHGREQFLGENIAECFARMGDPLL